MAVAGEAPAQGIKMEVGIEDCLHIEFEFDKQKYHLQDVILGKIYFLLVRIKIKFMELAVIRREAAGKIFALALFALAFHFMLCSIANHWSMSFLLSFVAEYSRLVFI